MVIARILKMVVASVAEAEVASLFHTAQDVEILAAPNKLQQLYPIENNATKHKPVNKTANLPLTGLTNLERLHNSRIQLPTAATAMVRLVNRLSNKCTQLS